MCLLNIKILNGIVQCQRAYLISSCTLLIKTLVLIDKIKLMVDGRSFEGNEALTVEGLWVTPTGAKRKGLQ